MIFLRIPASLSYRSLAMRTVSAACDVVLAEQADITKQQSEEFVNQAVSAVGEVFNNVVIHGYHDQIPGDISLAIDVVGDALVLEITDHGRVFHPDDAPEPDLSALPESGMGMFIIRAFVDEVQYTAGPPNTFRMIKRFPNKGNTPQET